MGQGEAAHVNLQQKPCWSLTSQWQQRILIWRLHRHLKSGRYPSDGSVDGICIYVTKVTPSPFLGESNNSLTFPMFFMQSSLWKCSGSSSLAGLLFPRNMFLLHTESCPCDESWSSIPEQRKCLQRRTVFPILGVEISSRNWNYQKFVRRDAVWGPAKRRRRWWNGSRNHVLKPHIFGSAFWSRCYFSTLSFRGWPSWHDLKRTVAFGAM